MKKLLVITRNHMDPSWRRCFTAHYTYRGDVIRPYSDIEEELIGQHLDFMEGGDWKYGIEQSLVLRKFLERNPDREAQVRRMIERGQLELLGGGEAVIDYNLVCGESIYRNHYYSIKYYQSTFGCRPAYVDCPDAFGLSGQMPQIFRQLGYIAMTQFDRVFKNNRPVWRGIDGSTVGLWSAYRAMSHHYPDCYKYTACGACHGDGCEMCGGTGIDFSYDYRYHEEPRDGREGLVYYAGPSCSTKEYIERFAASDAEENVLYISSEETRHMDCYPTMLRALCEQNGVTLCYMTQAELMEHLNGEVLQALREDCVPEDMIDPRADGNPVATGCYTSRIELKKKNRMLEQLVLSTEKLAALALPAEDYPHRGFARIWSMMAFLQFHDCVTASHCDASYDELLQVCRDIYSATARIRKRAMQRIEARTPVREMPGWRAVLTVNPTGKAWDDVPQTVVVRDKQVFEGVELCDESGRALPVLSLNVHNNALDCSAEVQTRLALPAMGVGVIYWRPAACAAVTCEREGAIENEYFTVSADGVYDKKRGRTVLGARAGALSVSYDMGHAWGRLAEESWRVPLSDSEACVRRGEGWQALVLRGGYADPERSITSLRWTRELRLYDGVDKIFCRTELDWVGESTHIYADFPLHNVDRGGKMVCEIPYGRIERCDGSMEVYKQLGIEDEWAALNWVAAYSQTENFGVVIYNKGTPGCRIVDGETLQISLLRSPTVLEFANEGARDHGRHVYEYAIGVEPCDGDPAGFGLRYTTPTPSIAATPKAAAAVEGSAVLCSPTTDDTSVQVTAIKRDEGGALIVRMYEAAGQSATVVLPCGMAAVEVDPLEERVLSEAIGTLHFRPFEIKTVRLVE